MPEARGASAAAAAAAGGKGAAGGGAAGVESVAAAEPAVATGKPAPKIKFSKRASRGMKTAPAYMSFDDVNVEGELGGRYW